MGKLPEGWRRVRLGDVFTENKKSPFKVEDADNEGKYPFFTSGDNILNHSIYLVEAENLFLSTGGTAYINYYAGKASYSADTYSIKSKINAKYLYYFALRKIGYITFRFFIGSGLEHLQKDDLKNSFKIVYPQSIEEQHKIAEILETVDNAIERTNTIIEKYKRVKQGLMRDLLTRGVVGNDELGVRSYELRDEKKHRFKDSPLGRIPEEWEVVELINGIGGNANLIVAGPFGSNLKVQDYKKTGIPIIRLQNIDENRFIDKDIKFIADKKAKELSYHSFISGDLILAKLGDPIGKTCIVPNNFKYGIVVADVVRIRVNEHYADKRFMSYILNFDICRNQLNTDIIGTTRPRVNLDQVRTAKIPFPPLPEQHRIASILSQMDQTIEKEQKYKQKLERIKQGLMENLLTGKVRVNHLISEVKK